MYILGLRNPNAQAIATDGLVNLGTPYRRYYKGCLPFAYGGDNQVTLQTTGIYKVVVNATFTGTTAGDATLELYQNGVATGASASETMAITTTLTSETKSVSFESFVLVDNTRVLNIPTITPATLTLVNSGVAITVTNVTMDIEKVL